MPAYTVLVELTRDGVQESHHFNVFDNNIQLAKEEVDQFALDRMALPGNVQIISIEIEDADDPNGWHTMLWYR